jgi:hypothetical protein
MKPKSKIATPKQVKKAAIGSVVLVLKERGGIVEKVISSHEEKSFTKLFGEEMPFEAQFNEWRRLYKKQNN